METWMRPAEDSVTLEDCCQLGIKKRTIATMLYLWWGWTLSKLQGLMIQCPSVSDFQIVSRHYKMKCFPLFSPFVWQERNWCLLSLLITKENSVRQWWQNRLTCHFFVSLHGTKHICSFCWERICSYWSCLSVVGLRNTKALNDTALNEAVFDKVKTIPNKERMICDSSDANFAVRRLWQINWAEITLYSASQLCVFQRKYFYVFYSLTEQYIHRLKTQW